MKVFKILVFPISLVYALVVYLRNFLFDKGFFASKSYNTPTICVGNLSVGGTGKTPMIEYLIDVLKPTSNIAVLSRGYGRKSKGFQLADKFTTVEVLGDEPFQIYSKFPTIAVSVDADRQNGISILQETIKPDVILLDDAFQHRKVRPKFSVLLTAYDNLFVNDWYLPTGTLRDSKLEAKRAGVIVVTKCPENISKEEQHKIVKKINPHKKQEVLFSYLKYDNQLKGLEIPLESLQNRKVTLVTGIANPKPLVAFLEKNNVTVEHLEYRDHHFFTDNEIALFNSKDLILTTEKDYVRLNTKVNELCYITIKHEFLNNGASLLNEKITTVAKN
ncbi:tetraacyldisaccharide 4'-kinase [Cellulophaga baltica]|uniref:tetraacyldisaccharide 4'-kinase n=1 Tax=Cellulophaga TaxID=104264 RepID=UPI001C070364|nr:MULTISPECIES: tetraacyldisaccharide 4'-kinase [Cellulophaga]MBU2994997.1 tetraacyldisaccharide 4'-kinase [Cellulophaga baltica]MDO6766392.1 tetraacyldisaccharide 4'-kinase [Cellulophaga sp. 1_MG-2023]